tara:strand:- start:4998 stop:7253 length:2256 start_codon:yes stop_codon:yes gene_type:complete
MKRALFFILIFFTKFVLAQNIKEVVNGHVFELISEDSIIPLQGVHVFYINNTAGTTTNEKGFFELDKNQHNKTLIFSFTGFKSDTLNLGKVKEINVVMREGKLLEDFVVEYKKGAYTFSKINPINVHTIAQDELRKAACCNLAESFETNPSIDATVTDAVTGTKQIKMMGLSGKYVQILSGNIPVIRGTSTLLGLELVPGSFIHQIAISKGAGSVLNGYESMVGQLNMNLKQPENAEKFHFNSYINQGGRAEQNIFFTKRISSKWATTLSAHLNNQTRQNDKNDDGFLDNPLLNNTIVYNQWNYRSEKIHLELGLNGVLANSKSGTTDQGLSYPVNIETQQANLFGKIGYLFPNDDFKSLALQLSATYNQQNISIGTSTYDGRQLSGYANLIYQQELGKLKENYFKLGASCQIDSVNEIAQPFLINPPSNQFLEIVPGVFSEFTHNSDKWGFILGMRGDYTSYYKKYFLTPRIHLRHNFNNQNALKLMFGSGRRTPFMLMENIGYMASNRNWVINNNIYGIQGLMSDVGQEYSWNVGIALLKEFTLLNRDGTMTLDAYHTFFINQLVVDLDQTTREVNFYSLSGDSYSNSLQSEINYDLNRRLSARISYRFLDVKTKLRSKGLIRQPFISRHRGFLNIEYKTRKIKNRQWKFDFTSQWIGAKRLPNTSENPSEFQLEEYSPDFFLLNGQITRIASKRTQLYLGVENALNYRQKNPIISANNPKGQYFDSAIIWGPIFGRMTYFGIRFTLKE